MLKPRFIEITDPSLQLKNGNKIFTSLEGENPGGSIKDHMVIGEIEDLFRKKSLREGAGISEVSAGSTAASLAHYCPQYGLKCVLFVPTTVQTVLVDKLQGEGAEVHQEEMAEIYPRYDIFSEQQKHIVRFNQLFDDLKRRHYHSFGRQLKEEIEDMDAVMGAVGTGHSLLGIWEGLDRDIPVITAEPDGAYKVSGVRNITKDRYGENDTLGEADFSKRIIVPESQLIEKTSLITSAGLLEVNASFALVLAAAKNYLSDKKNQRIFTVGASLKRLGIKTLKRTA